MTLSQFLWDVLFLQRQSPKKAGKEKLHFGLFLGLFLCSIITFPLTKKETHKKTTKCCGLFAIIKPIFSTSCVWMLKIVLHFFNETFLTFLDLNLRHFLLLHRNTISDRNSEMNYGLFLFPKYMQEESPWTKTKK